MAISQKQYERALAMARDPSLSDDDKNLIADAIEEYRASSTPAEVSPTATIDAERRKENAGEGPLLSAPGAESEFAQQPMNSPGAFDVPTAPQMAETDAAVDSPNVRRARKFQVAPPSKPKKVVSAEEIMGAADQEELDQRMGPGAGDDADYDLSNTTSASKRRELIRPPSFTPEAAPSQGIQQKIINAYRGLPTALGGQVQHFEEPGLDIFRKTMGPLLGEDEVKKMGVTSDAYKEFADAVWKTVYEKSKTEGTPVVRQQYAGGLLGSVAGLMGDAGSFAGGYGEGFTGTGALNRGMGRDDPAAGLDEPGADKITNMDAIESASPIAHTIGMGMGLINPRSIGNLAASGAGKIAGKLGFKEATSVAGKLGQGAVRGFTQGAAATGVSDVASELSGEQNLSSEERAMRILTGGASGIPFGVVGAGGKAYSDRLRKGPSGELRPLGQLEESFPDRFEYGKDGTKFVKGARTAVRGIQPGDEAMALKERAAGERLDPRDMLARDMEGPVASYARTERERLTQAAGNANRQGYKTLAGEKRSYAPLLDILEDEHEALTTEAGGKLPFASGHSDIREQIGRMVDMKIVPRDQATALTSRTGQRGVARTYTIDEARRKGFDVNSLLKEEGLPLEDMGDDLAVKVIPRDVDPHGLDTVVRVIDNANQQSPLMRHQEFQSAARRIRDAFPPEWKAVKSAEGKAFHDYERDVGAMGLGQGVGEHGLTANQARSVQDTIRMGGSRRSAAVEEPTRRVTQRAGVGRQYGQVQGLNALEDVQKAAKLRMPTMRFGFGGGMGATEALPGGFAGYHLDPLLRKFGPSFGGAGAAFSQSGPTIDQISRMLAPPEEQR